MDVFYTEIVHVSLKELPGVCALQAAPFVLLGDIAEHILATQLRAIGLMCHAPFCSSHVVQSRDNASASHSRNCRRRSSKIILTKMSNSTPAGPASCPGATTASCCRVTGSQLWRIAMRRDDTVSFVARSVFSFQFGCLNASLFKFLGRIVFRHWGSWRGGALTI